MHLILETKPSVDIKDKMSTVEEKVIEKFEVNKPPEITNGHNENYTNSDDDREVVTQSTETKEDNIICKENGISKSEASQIDNISESNGNVEQASSSDKVEEPMTYSNETPDKTKPELTDKYIEDVPRNNENAYGNDSLMEDDFQLVFDYDDDEALKSDRKSVPIIDKDCKGERITQNFIENTIDAMESEKMDTYCPIESSTDNIVDNEPAVDINSDIKDGTLSEVIDPTIKESTDDQDQAMETENSNTASITVAMEMQSEVIETSMDPITESKIMEEIIDIQDGIYDIAEIETDKTDSNVKDHVEKTDNAVCNVKLSTNIETSTIRSDKETITDEKSIITATETSNDTKKPHEHSNTIKKNCPLEQKIEHVSESKTLDDLKGTNDTSEDKSEVITTEIPKVNTIDDSETKVLNVAEVATKDSLDTKTETENKIEDNFEAKIKETFEVKIDDNNKSSVDQINETVSVIIPEIKTSDEEIVDITQDKTDINDISCVISDSDEKKKVTEIPSEKSDAPIEIMDVDESETSESQENNTETSPSKQELTELTEIVPLDKQKPEIIDLDKDSEQKPTEKSETIAKTVKRTISGLCNTLNILSDDDEDELSSKQTTEESVFDKLLRNDDSNDKNVSKVEKDTKAIEDKEAKSENETAKSDDKCIALDDDDDVMLIDEDSQDEKPSNDDKVESPVENIDKVAVVKAEDSTVEIKEDKPASPKEEKKVALSETKTEEKPAEPEKPKTLIPDTFLKTTKKAIADMTREDLEEFCLEKIAEAVIDRNNLGEIKTKLKQMLQNVEEWKNKSLILTKQNRDLQIVLKAIEEEMKKRTNTPIKPLKISRSVGMQVLITESDKAQKKRPQPKPNTTQQTQSTVSKPVKQMSNQAIPVPILVPANGRSPAKPVPQTRQTNLAKNINVASKSPVNKPAEKRPLSSADTACVDLTDDEPPPKQQATTRNAVQAPVRVVAPHQLMAQKPQVNQQNGPRKVYIPINSNNNSPRSTQLVRGVTVANNLAPRQRTVPNVIRMNNPMGQTRTLVQVRHPAPLPNIARQPTQPNWKAVPPAPDLKISKVENGIVISWKIEGYQEDSYEEIASYQLFAYQETQSPPSTLLWKKIGDVKALPLPMACTLTQFMAGYKYYFAVRAVDIRKRIGSFSLPGSILLLTGP